MKKIILACTALALSSGLHAALQRSHQEKRQQYLQQQHFILRPGAPHAGQWGLPGSVQTWYHREILPDERPTYLQETQKSHREYFVNQIKNMHAAETHINHENLSGRAWKAWTVRVPALLSGVAAGFFACTHALSNRTKAIRLGGALGAAASATCLTAWLCHKLVCYKNGVFKQEKDLNTMAQEIKDRWTLFRQNPRLLPDTTSLDRSDPFQPDVIRMAIFDTFRTSPLINPGIRTQDLLDHLQAPN